MIKPILTSSLSTFLLGVFLTNSAFAQINADYTAVPPSSADVDTPQVMLTMSRDHQYFFKAYNDYTDLDPEKDDGVEITYKNEFNYFGYFDSAKCYEYSAAGGEFRPVSVATNNYCSGSEWSGNFLNWATMTRMDVVRKIFYGGKRSTDTDSKTVLERAFLPQDAHSFSKYYNGSDIDRLTPYNNVRTDTANGGDNDGLDDINEGITFCNTTEDRGNVASQNSNAPPLIRVAIGNFQLWNSNERWQCSYLNDRPNEQGNFNIPPSAPEDFNIGGTIITVDSGIDAEPRDPVSGDDYIVRVEVCNAGLLGEERCKQYPNGEPKPIGLLQTYGDDGLIDFGLMTGSYQNNIQGGVLRKNIDDFANEVDVDGDGTFTFTNTSESIIRTLDSLRMWGYSYNNGTYRGGGQFDDCTFQLSEIPNGRCNSWGNPISEIYKESIRYMAGLSAQANFDSNDSTFISGLRTEDWQDPLTEDNQCSDLSTILINASVSSYDDNDVAIPGVPGGINGANTTANNTTTDTWTDNVGTLEGIAGGARQFFIGRNGANNNEVCDAKTIPALSDVLGLCPEAPTVNGSFAMAGIAYYAHNNDIRSDLEGNQTINTFAISLATNVPIIRVPRTDGGTPVEILPAYRNLDTPADPGGGALVDFRIVQPHTSIGADEFRGKFYVSWEDSEQGGDYDQDAWGLIEYTLNERLNQITITTTVVGESTTTPQLFGFVTNGTTQDGFHAYSGITGANYVDPTGVPGCNNCRPLKGTGGATGQSGPQSHTFNIAPTTVETLESPLYYAAKYGGFEENRGPGEAAALNDEPDEIDEWDAVDNITGAAIADGLPDNFFFVINPENLFNSIEASLDKILSQNRSSSSAVASFANSNGFGDLIIQGTFQELTLQPSRRPGGGATRPDLNWTGELFSYFTDRFGLFREDTNQNGILDDYGVDRVFRYELDESQPDSQPEIQYQNVDIDGTDGLLVIDDGAPSVQDDGSPVPLSALNSLWNAGDRLRALNNEGTRTQRPYDTAVPTNSTSTAPSRYIFTYISGNQVDFLPSTFDATNFGFLGVGSEAVADSIVEYIRGYEDPAIGFRNRTLVETDGTETVYRLGDIVNSRPLVVASPQAGYDTRFEDESYANFVEKYRNRRNVVYVGGNDGLLHAFNAGFRDSSDQVPAYLENDGVAGTANHPLGAEIWAYAPFNLLPHLQWLTSNFYSHVFYVDGSPQAHDVKIFTPSDKHPGGWGTILVVGMRQGGGDFPISQGGISLETRSSYIVLDITDPEDPPEVLAEINHPDLNMTTSDPDIFYDCGRNCDGLNANTDDDFDGDWKLVFGSGPSNLKNFTTTETAKIFTYDLKTKDLDVNEVEQVTGGAVPTPATNSFVGDVVTADWDNGKLGFRNDDVVYFGTVGARLDTSTPDPTDLIETGGVYRFFPGDTPFGGGRRTNLLIDTDRPVVQKPTVLSRENLGNDILGSWVYFGTGIYLTRDNEETSEQERFYGVLETVDRNAILNLDDIETGALGNSQREDSELLTYETVNIGDMQDVTSGVVQLVDGDTVLRDPIAGTNSPGELARLIVTTTQGWYRDLPLAVVAGDPTSRVTDAATAFLDQLFFVTFAPQTLAGVDICEAGVGVAELFVVDQTIGLPLLGTLGEEGAPGGPIEFASSTSIGNLPTKSPVVSATEGLGANSGSIILQRGDGSIIKQYEDPTDPSRNFNLGNATLNGIGEQRTGWRELIELTN